MTAALYLRGTLRQITSNPALWLVAPAVATLLPLVLIPTIGVFAVSLTDWRLGSRSFSFVGLGNYLALLTNPTFRTAILNTLTYVAIVVPGSIILGLTVALLIEAGRSGRTLYQTIHFLPVLSTMAAMAFAWEAILHPFIGVANAVTGLFGLPAQNWLTDPHLVIYTLAVIGIWQNAGFCMVLFIAALRSIPHELLEAADVDGVTGPWDRFSVLILPMLGPVLLFVSTLTIIRAMQVFDTVAILTSGGPSNASNVLVYSIYQQGVQYLNTAAASAMVVFFVVAVMSFTLSYLRLADRRTHYQ
jgi:multiple sugar transport system permease protein